MYLFFVWSLDFDFDAGKFITRATEGVGHENRYYLDPGNQRSELPFVLKKLLALVMNLPASKSLRPAPYKQQVH